MDADDESNYLTDDSSYDINWTDASSSKSDYSSDASLSPPSTGLTKRMIALYVCIAIAAAVNAFLLLTVFSSRKLRRGANAPLVVFLVVADILQMIVISVGLHLLRNHSFDLAGYIGCKGGMFLDSMFGGMSVFMLVAIASERYVAVVKPLSFQKRSGSPLCWGMTRVAIAWLLASLLAAPELLVFNMVDEFGQLPSNEADYEYDAYDYFTLDGSETTESTDYSIPVTIPDLPPPTITDTNFDTIPSMSVDNGTTVHPSELVVIARYCNIDAPDWLSGYVRVRPAVMFAVFYAVPMLVIGTLYGLTAHTLATSAQRRGSGEQFDKRRTAARSVVALVTIVVVCLLPIHILTLLTEYKLVEMDKLQWFAQFSFVMFTVNTTLNAVMVCVLSQQYRRQVLVLVGVLFCRRRARTSHRLLSLSPSANRLHVHWRGETRTTQNDGRNLPHSPVSAGVNDNQLTVTSNFLLSDQVSSEISSSKL
jgi:hypothetical protein